MRIVITAAEVHDFVETSVAVGNEVKSLIPARTFQLDEGKCPHEGFREDLLKSGFTFDQMTQTWTYEVPEEAILATLGVVRKHSRLVANAVATMFQAYRTFVFTMEAFGRDMAEVLRPILKKKKEAAEEQPKD